MSVRAGRTIILEPVNGDRGMEAPTAELFQRLQDLVGTLMTVGGEFTVRADRVRLGELPAEPERCPKCKGAGSREYDGEPDVCRACAGKGTRPGKPDAISETVGFFLEWRNVPRLPERPLTTLAMNYVLGTEDEERDRPSEAAVASALAPEPEPEPDEDLDDDAGVEPEEE